MCLLGFETTQILSRCVPDFSVPANPRWIFKDLILQIFAQGSNICEVLMISL